MGGGNTHTVKWQSSRPNPLPSFAIPNHFYTPMLLPGVYLPLNMFSELRATDDGIPFYIMEDPVLAEQVAAFLAHEDVHRNLLVGIVPTLMRLIASRCYLLLALLEIYGFQPLLWRHLESQSNTIDKLFKATAPLHEIVANVRTIIESKGNPYAINIGKQSLLSYKDVYGTNFTSVFSCFSFIINSLEDWFASPVQTNILLYLAEYMLLGAIDLEEIRDDLFASPPQIPKDFLPNHLAQFGIPYFEKDKKLLKLTPLLALSKIYTYSVYDTTAKLQEIISGIHDAKIQPTKKPLKTDIEQLLYLAKAIPKFHEWLQCTDILFWLKRRIWDAISETQEMIGGSGFELPLVEAWQLDLFPYISISLINKSTNEVTFYDFGTEGKKRNLFEAKMSEHIWSANLISFYLQADKPLGIWYAPACDKVNRTPITPSVFIMSDDSKAYNLVGPMHNLAVFESLRIQVAEGNGIDCLLRHQYGGDCCGCAGLIWSIYEAGMKAKDFGWEPTNWIEPECSKTESR